MPVQYMTEQGVWRCSCQSEADKPDPALVLAPADADGFCGMEWMAWDGVGWVQYIPPPDSCTALQGRRALGMERVQHIDDLVAHLDLLRPDLSAEEIWVVQMAWRHAATWERLGHEVNLLRDLYGMSEEERDQFMRLAVTL